MTETQFKTLVQRYLDTINAYHVKQHGNRFTRSGVPDILICYKGKFIGLELKVDKNKPSELQKYHIDKIKNAGGIGLVIYPADFEGFKKFMERVGSDETK